LRDRPQDIPELIEHFLITRQLGPTRYQIQPDAREALMRHDWPGNVRELANVLERAQILAEEHCITLDDLPETLVTSHAQAAGGSEGDDPRHLDSVERRHVLTVLQQEKGNKVHAAKALGISRRALYRLLEKYKVPA
jgi:DNA-binding NtrC family response regulator